MSSVPVPTPVYRRPTLRIVATEHEPELTRPFRRRRRTIRTLREQILCDPQYCRYHVI